MQELKGKRIVLFGAGRVARRFIIKYRFLNFIAILDNDPNKCNEFFNDIPILCPASVDELNYDFILISTGWIDSILKQLKSLGVCSDKVLIPQKSLFSINSGDNPFENNNTKKVVIDIMKVMSSFSFEYNFKLILDFGTLLGAIRNNDFIQWDDDVDLSMNDLEFDRFVRALPILKEKLPKSDFFNIDIAILFNKETPCVVNLTISNGFSDGYVVPIEIGVVRRVFINDYAYTMSTGAEFYAPKKHFEKLDSIYFQETLFYIPFDVKEYLCFVYGDWAQPRKNTTLAEYPKVDFDHCSMTVVAV